MSNWIPGSFCLPRSLCWWITVRPLWSITVYRNGQLYIENVGDRASAELKHCHNGETEPNSTVEVELTNCGKSTAPLSLPDAKTDSNSASKDGASDAAAGGDTQGSAQTEQPKKRRRKPKRTIIIDCERKISACKGTHPDVALFFIHGVGGSSDIWGSQLDFFSRLGYEVIAPDRSNMERIKCLLQVENKEMD